MSVILAISRLRQEDHEVKASLGYIMRLCIKKKKRINIFQVQGSSIGGVFLLGFYRKKHERKRVLVKGDGRESAKCCLSRA
jgi:hypothetical protein